MDIIKLKANTNRGPSRLKTTVVVLSYLIVFFIGCSLGPSLAGIPDRLLAALAVLIGFSTTLTMGLFTGRILEAQVTVELPPEFSGYESAGGGQFLGLLERLLFYISAWPNLAVLAAGWLAFKAAAKWASWQHVYKVPETLSLNKKNRLASWLLGRFLIGTLYNAMCGLVGAGLTMLLLYFWKVKLKQQ